MHVIAVTAEMASHVLIFTNVPMEQIFVMATLLAETLEVHSLVHARLGTVVTEKHAMTLMSVRMTETIAMFKRLV